METENVSNTRFYDFKKDYFSIIDAPVKAYIVGFLAADGGVDRRLTHLSVKVSKRDESVLQLILDELDHKTPIRHRIGKVIGDTKYVQSDYCFIKICGGRVVSDLVALGVTPQKSLTLLPPKNIPENLLKYWILGYFDGDGTVHHLHKQSPRFSFLGTPDVLRFIQDHLVENAGLTRNKISKKKNANHFALAWGGAVNTIKFREYMYDKEAWFPFQRKRDRFFHAKRKERVYKKGKTVIQMDVYGNEIRTWSGGVVEAVRTDGYCLNHIYQSANHGNLAHGFKWKWA